MGKDILFFVAILAFIFGAWVVAGGPSRPISFAGPYLYPIAGPGEIAQPYSLGQNPNVSPDESDTLDDLRDQIDNTNDFGEPSPYKDLITITHNTSGALQTDPKKEYIALQVSLRAKDPIDITGWKLQSVSSNTSVVLPQGAEILRSGTVNQLASIKLYPGGGAIITTGHSPIGASFEENMCTGYLDQFQTFYPSLENYCPTSMQEFQEFSNEPNDSTCRAFVQKTNRCSIPQDVPSSVSDSCESFIQKELNYNGCVKNHEEEGDFLTGSWRVYLGKSKELWKKNRETIRLLDRDGKTVDMFAY